MRKSAVKTSNAQFFITIGKELNAIIKSKDPHSQNWSEDASNIMAEIFSQKIENDKKKEFKGKRDLIDDDKTFCYIALIVFLGNKVYQQMGGGFKEEVYQDSFEQELIWNHIPYVREKHLSIYYPHPNEKTVIELQHTYRADFFINNNVVVETKARFIDSQNKKFNETNPDWVQKQIENYLAATRKKIGVLLNFYGNTKNIYSTIYIVNPKNDL